MVQLEVNQQFRCEQAKDAKKDDQDERGHDPCKDVRSVNEHRRSISRAILPTTASEEGSDSIPLLTISAIIKRATN